MKHLRMFGKFWYDFIVGDDWRDAAGAALAIALSFVGSRPRSELVVASPTHRHRAPHHLRTPGHAT